MKKIILIGILVVLVGAVGIRVYQETAAEADSTAAGVRRGGSAPSTLNSAGRGGGRGGRGSLLVDTGIVEPHVFDTGREFVGELAPFREVSVIPRASGYLQSVDVEQSDTVATGQLLAEIASDDIEQQIRRQEAALAVADAGAARERATLENLRVQVQRNQSLYQDGLVALQAVEDIESRFRVGEAQLGVAEAQVDQARATLEELRIQFERSRVYAPMAGVVALRHLDPGALVGQSTPIVTLMDLSRLKMVVVVPERAIADFRTGNTAEVVLDALPQRRFNGRITRISPFVNPETRSVDVEIQIENGRGDLRPGMFARVQMGGVASAPAMSIPRSALVTRGTVQGVYLLAENNVARFREVQMGRNEDGWVEVLGGLGPDEVFVTSGAPSLTDGDTVRLADGGQRGRGVSARNPQMNPDDADLATDQEAEWRGPVVDPPRDSQEARDGRLGPGAAEGDRP